MGERIRSGLVAVFAAWLTGCASLTVFDVTYVVPESLAAEYHRGAPGLLQSSEGGDIAAVCGQPLEVKLASRYQGCRPDEHDVVIEAWIVPVPNSWDTALCYDPITPGEEITDSRYPREDLPEPVSSDPYAEVDAKWSWTPFCGGKLTAELTIDG